ncbi:MAG: HEAT repeat domain-containing protein, partial [Alphaproteobacteria bacterium]|nr:HEAT repeat domain-containing protein [Alphaproteobacteria bacterium]
MSLALFLTLFLLGVLGALACFGGVLILRRTWVARSKRAHDIHLRLIRAELMQVIARGDESFIIAHWTKQDRKAAFEVSAQILCLLRGRERERLLDIIDANHILREPLGRINRKAKLRRIAIIRRLVPYDTKTVVGILDRLMVDDPEIEVRFEAALALAKNNRLDTPWRVIEAICPEGTPLAPAHRQLFRSMMPQHSEGFMTLALYQDRFSARVLAIDALGSSHDYRIAQRLEPLIDDDDPRIRIEAIKAAQRIGHSAALLWIIRACANDDTDVRA